MLTIHEFDLTEAAYNAIVAIWNANWPDRPVTVAAWQRTAMQRNPTYAYARFVVKQNERIIAYGGYEEPVWSAGTGAYVLFYEVDPAHDNNEIHGLLCQHITQRLASLPGATKLITANLREDKPAKIAFLLSNGFQQVMRHPIARLDVAAFEVSRYAAALARVQAAGIVIRPLSELQSFDPEWQSHLWMLDNAAFQTMPTVAEITERPYAEYRKRFAEPGFTPAAWMIATAQTNTDPVGPYVGMSTLWPDANDATRLWQGFTGVDPAYRRRGIATALKVHTIHYARRQGVKYIVTENAEGNPMVQINLQLGFAPQPAWVNLEKYFLEEKNHV
ncbi:MAG: GNAT family N-acetyltransferase [Caldilineaceae bacterium]